MARCTPWKRQSTGRAAPIWQRSCGAYHARIIKSGLRVKGQRMPRYRVRVFFARTGIVGREIDHSTEDSLAAAKKFANPRLTGRG